ncbi:MAG: capsule biosynthesis protein [Neisseriaceae bacterium]|nr:capsule biosynthesis protein [Neisseriaceae bacterium]
MSNETNEQQKEPVVANTTEQTTVNHNESEQTVQVASKKNKKKRDWLFWTIVGLPTAISLVYFGLIASNQYISESSFLVRSAKNQANTGALGALFQGMGIARSQDDTYAVQEYMRSRTALGELSKNIPVRSFYQEKGDIFSKFNGLNLSYWQNDEAFYQYYTDKIIVNVDPVSGVSTLQVNTFDAAQSKQINEALLQKAEQLINNINDRARLDTITYAEKNLKTAQENASKTAQALMAYRTKNGVLDLKQQSEMKMALMAKLQDELISIQTQLDQVRAVTPENPQISGLQAREQSLKNEIRKQSQLITGSDNQSIAKQAAKYQQLALENELANQQVSSALSALETARAEADRQQLYLEVVAQPSQPDMPQKPTRIYNIIATFVISLMVYGVVKLLTASIREHRN